MSPAMERLLRADYMSALFDGKRLEQYRPSELDYYELLQNPALYSMPSKPIPPIRREVHIQSLFYSRHEVEKDYHAPEYLEALAAWKRACKEREGKPPILYGIEIMSPNG